MHSITTLLAQTSDHLLGKCTIKKKNQAVKNLIEHQEAKKQKMPKCKPPKAIRTRFYGQVLMTI